MSEVLSKEVLRSRSGMARTMTSRGAVMWYLVLAVVLLLSLTVSGFASARTAGFLLLDVIPILMIALPMTLVIITGEIDLSVASTAGLASAIMGVLWAGGMNIYLVLVVCLVVGLLAGTFNGLMVTWVGLPSLAVTIGTLALFRGLALVVIGDNAVANFPRELTTWATSKIGATGIPVFMLVVLALIVIFGVVLHLTPFGRALFAIGFSKEAAEFVGIDVGRAKFYLYVATGLVSSMAGVFWTLRYSSARSDNASGLELAVIAAVLLGGVSIFGGRGSIPGAVAGVLMIGIVNYALRLQRISDVVLIVVTGTLLIASVVGPSIFQWLRRFRHDRRVHKDLTPASNTVSTAG